MSQSRTNRHQHNPAPSSSLLAICSTAPLLSKPQPWPVPLPESKHPPRIHYGAGHPARRCRAVPGAPTVRPPITLRQNKKSQTNPNKSLTSTATPNSPHSQTKPFAIRIPRNPLPANTLQAEARDRNHCSKPQRDPHRGQTPHHQDHATTTTHTPVRPSTA